MIFSFLKKRYPYYGDSGKGIISYFFIGLFVALFLIVFQPFGTREWHTENKILKLAGYGFISFIIPLAASFILQKFVTATISEERWTTGKEILSILFILLLIATGNLLYGRWLGVMPINGRAFLFAIASTLIIGVFPVTLHVIRKHNYFLKMNLEQALEANKRLQGSSHLGTIQDSPAVQQTDEIILIAENEKDVLKLQADELLYIESADNYAEVIFVKNGSPKKELLRASLKRIESQVNHPDIFRCHRAYIVNTRKIIKVEGNAAGYRLFFEHSDKTVSVSRAYVQKLNEKLRV